MCVCVYLPVCVQEGGGSCLYEVCVCVCVGGVLLGGGAFEMTLPHF